MSKKQDRFVQLAKKAIEYYFENKKNLNLFSKLPSEMLRKRAGVFVTLKKGGKLRGCIGTYLPTRKNIAEEVTHSAVQAAFADPRFEPLKKEELPEIEYEVSILGGLKPVKDIKELNPKKYGILVRGAENYKTGILLPDIKGIDKIEEQVYKTKKKAGIDPLREKFSVYKFEVEKH